MPIPSIRPYQLACLFCRAGGADAIPAGEWISALAAYVREHPDAPLTVVANAGDVYVYQDPGTAEDTPGGPELNRKRDLDLLQKIDLAPGSTLPARTLLKRLLWCVDSVRGICGYDTVTGPAWQGCALADSGCYERGRESGIDALIPPRTEAGMAEDKRQSIEAIMSRDEVAIRPHIVLCAICQYAGGIRPPDLEDNLPEFLQEVLKGRAIHVRLQSGAPWDMCAPCPHRVTETGACVIGRIGSGGLYNEMKDLNVLQALGLKYGDVVEARALYKLIFERIPTVDGVCALHTLGNPEYSVWRDGCSSMTFPGPYEQGREMLWDEFGCE